LPLLPLASAITVLRQARSPLMLPRSASRWLLAMTLLGRTIRYRELTFEENKDAMIRAGVPAPVAEMNAQAFSLTADGDAEWISDDVPALLRRPARSFGQFAADYAAAFS
jgi:hypothetical protein